jgi:hypothetical protein
MSACGVGCVLFLQRFSAPVSMWDVLFSPHADHSFMQSRFGCECGSMQRLCFFPQETIAIKLHNAIRIANKQNFFLSKVTDSAVNGFFGVLGLF